MQKFTIKVLRPNPHREKTQIWRAGQIVTGMEGCRIENIVQALTALESDTRKSGEDDPARWITHFAGLESKKSGKALDAWIEILYEGKRVESTREYRTLLKER